MTPPNTIAIDGPAASGKSTLGCNLARELGYICLDTGIMYRAVTWKTLQQGIDPGDEAAVSALAGRLQIDVTPPTRADGRSFDFLVDGEDITAEIRQSRVEAHVSQVSAYPGVRQAMTEQQRRIASRGKIIMVGRDIGTVVLPDADLKIYLVASLEERARRRLEEKTQRGEQASLAEIRRNLELRDLTDSSREVAPLKPAEDAIVLNSDGLSIEEVLIAAKKMVK
ncbi:MAG TPA: (d)CMP kinase [Anaerolineaceae bacterium]